MSSKKMMAVFALIIVLGSRVLCDAPKLTVVLVVDQFAYHYVQRLSPYFTHGIKLLTDNGVNFQNAHHPHAAPTTATGHVTISTGSLAKDHGVILNSWKEGDEHVKFPCDESPAAAELTKNGVENYGFSAHQIMTDTISDQLILHSRPDDANYVYAVSLKERAAIGMAGKMGKAIWHSKKQNKFTSSKAYFEKMPSWLVKFNKENNLKDLKEIDWALSYPRKSDPYNFFNIQNYKFSKSNNRLAGQLINIKDSKDSQIFQKTPYGNELLLSMGKQIIDNNVEKLNTGKMLLWISLSSLDKIGHEFGPYSLEVIDMIYNLDVQLEAFIHHAQDRFGAENVLFVLTADHGVAPIPEILESQGFITAGRVDSKVLMSDMNKLVSDKFEIDGLIQEFRTNQFYFDRDALKDLDKKKKREIFANLQEFLSTYPAIKSSWSQEDLVKTKFSKNYYEQLYKNQLYPGRSGDLTIMSQPYCSVIKYHKGTTHRSPYEYDTHVPLIFYQEGKFTNKNILKKVSMTQLAPTLAKILQVPAPATSSNKVLPEIF